MKSLHIKRSVGILAIAGLLAPLISSSAYGYTLNRQCTAGGDTMWNVVYYSSAGSNWYVSRETFTLSSGTGPESNVNIRIRDIDWFYYFVWNSADNLSGGKTYTKHIQIEAPKNKGPYILTQFIPDQFGPDPNCWTKATFVAQ